MVSFPTSSSAASELCPRHAQLPPPCTWLPSGPGSLQLHLWQDAIILIRASPNPVSDVLQDRDGRTKEYYSKTVMHLEAKDTSLPATRHWESSTRCHGDNMSSTLTSELQECFCHLQSPPVPGDAYLWPSVLAASGLFPVLGFPLQPPPVPHEEPVSLLTHLDLQPQWQEESRIKYIVWHLKVFPASVMLLSMCYS